jgi:sugar phosphate isomerase/epimerase
MIEIGCQTYSLRHLSPVEMLESVRKAGFRRIELWLGHADYRTGPTSAAAVRHVAERIGIAIQAYSIGGLMREPLEVVEARLTEALPYAARLGTDLVTGIVDRRAVPVVDAACRRTGMRFAVENHWYADLARAEGLAEALADASPLVGVTLDTGHLVAAGDDPVDALAVLGERLMNVHLKDVIVPGRFARLVSRKPRMEPRTVGSGQVPVGRLLAALSRRGYAGSVALEDERPDLPLWELQASLRACTVLLRTLAAPLAAAEVVSCTSSS